MILGSIGSIHRATVRAGGVIVLGEGGPDEIEIAWWVGAEDRWHLPEREITTRQSLVRSVPVIQTSVRIPSGDAVATCAAVVQGPRELVVLDVENRSKVPFALAVVLRGPGVRDVRVDGTTVRVGGYPLLTLPRSPQRSACVPAGGDLASVVLGGDAGEQMPTVDGPAEAAVLLPVTHGTSQRVAVLLGATGTAAFSGAPVLSALPTVHTIANGWEVHLARGPRLTLPDRELVDRTAAAVGALLLLAEPAVAQGAPWLVAAELARACDRAGLHEEAAALLEDAPTAQSGRGLVTDEGSTSMGRAVEVTGTVVHALALHAAITRDRVFAQTMAPVVSAGLEAITKAARKDPEAGRWLATLPTVASLLDVSDDPGAARQARRMWEREGRPDHVPLVPLAPLPARSAGGSLVPDDPRRIAALVDEVLGEVAHLRTDDGVDLLPGFRDEWRGQNLELRNVAVPGGRVSLAVRWHGARAALLWERTGDLPVTLHLSSLSSTWSSTASSGEALL